MTSKNFRQGLAAGLMCLSLTFLASVAINLRVSTTSFEVEIGEAAHAKGALQIKRIFQFVFGNIIQSGTAWALDNPDKFFKPQQQSIGPATNGNAIYIGSSFVARVNYQGTPLIINYLATLDQQWYCWDPRQRQWVYIGKPIFSVYRTADIYMNSSGNLFFL